MASSNGSSKLVIKITASCFVLALAVILFAPASPSLGGPAVAYAQTTNDVNQNLEQVAAETPLQNAGLITIVGRVIKIFIGILGVIALIIVLYAGFIYMTSGGDQEKVMTAKKWLINGVIGLAIIFSAYSITVFIFNLFTDNEYQLAGGPQYQTAGLTGGAYGISGGAFGNIIQNHFPKPEQTGVPRNTMILVTFKTPILPDSVIDITENVCPDSLDPKTLCGAIKKDAFRVFRCADMIAEAFEKPEGKTCASVPFFDIAEGNACKADAECKGGLCSNGVCTDNKLVSGYGIITEDHKTIIFNPYGDLNQHLGDANNDVPYIVYLTPAIKKDSDPKQTIFSKAYPDYKWRFTTSIFLDLTPPTVSSVVPAKVPTPPGYPLKVSEQTGCKCKKGEEIGCSKVDCDGYVYLNQAIYVNFNEPVIPPLTQTQNCNAGDSDNEAQLVSEKVVMTKDAEGKDVLCQNNHVPGGWKVGINQYKTVQFVAKTKCAGGATNSCGEPAFCLPEKTDLTGKVLAAKILTGTIGLPGTGIMDLAGNSLDGNANGKTEGPGTLDAKQDEAAALDNFLWTFATGNALDLTGPAVIKLEPNNATGDLGNLDTIIKAFFTEYLDADSVDTQVELIGRESDGKDFKSWFDANLGSTVLTEMVDGKPVVVGEEVDMTQVAITHGSFGKYNEGDKFLPIYTPIMKSGIKDSRQNCFSPMKEDPGANVDKSNCAQNNKAGQSCCPNSGFMLNPVPNPVGEDASECAMPDIKK
ncbi:hypothetical protein A2482_04925 [Candidatus Falkowbacteria bacterium RIFOXYC2_FULL_48_21]|uniref:SbsA Ig-like domain-containing protein n=1 Tax=Candidatus Falkowbacteria bacterium RIFOXYC2_FULL_48_21 TaxID=1798005 RepID=A0A1F5T7E0_9BACT|nr:MAG: hypothetical protein A2482_04925 [Candidatus Falkowbacteria bacterium RIFOXYC2_FULL_48_21]